METDLWAVYCENTILENYPFPVPALITVNGSLVENIQILPQPLPFSNIKLLYPNITIFYYEDSYLLPGLIDSNVKLNGDWEGCENGTKTAISGGVTFTCVEKNFFGLNEDYGGNLFCDLGFLARIQDFSDLNSVDIKNGPFLAVKTYLNPQSKDVDKVKDINRLFREIEVLGMPVIVDCALTNGRMLHVASPFRTETIEKRVDYRNRLKSIDHFLVAVDMDVNQCDSNSSGDEEIEENKCCRKESTNSECYEELTRAELDSYSYESTDFSDENSVTKCKSLELDKHSTRRNSKLDFFRPPSLQMLDSPKYDEQNYQIYYLNVPTNCESAGIDKILEVYNGNYPLHFSNLSCVESFQRLINIKEILSNVTIETCPHYLYFSSENIPDKDTRFKTFPPIRNQNNQKFLVKYLKKDKIDIISSNHNPIHPDYKMMEFGQFRRALPGVNSLGFSLQAIWSVLMKKKEENIGKWAVKIAKWMSWNQAKLLGIEKYKGSIAVGKHADFVVWRPREIKEEREYHTKYPENCIYSGKKLSGEIEAVYLRGKLAFYKGEFHAHGMKMESSLK